MTEYEKDLKGMEVNLAGVLFKVEFESRMVDRFNTSGQIDFFRNRIALDPELGDRDTLSVFLHELIEGVVRRYQVKIDHDLVVFLECALFSLFMSNPHILEVFLKEAKYGKGRIQEIKEEGTAERKTSTEIVGEFLGR